MTERDLEKRVYLRRNAHRQTLCLDPNCINQVRSTNENDKGLMTLFCFGHMSDLLAGPMTSCVSHDNH